jgi:Winged helix DNA-binding domain
VAAALTPAALNRAVLARQRLLDPAPAAPADALEAVAGIQAQYAPSMYVGLWTRNALARRDDLTELLERREVVQGTLMRSTIHLVSRADWWPLAVAVRRSRRTWYERSHRDGPTGRQLAGAARRLRGRLLEGPMTRAEIETLVGKEAARYAGLWLDMIRVPPGGTWARRRADVYALAEAELGPPAITEGAAREHLVRRYLAGFGPATRHDVASFTGLALREAGALLGRMDLDELEGPDRALLLDLPGAPRPDPETPAPVRLLPHWDATLLVHARRTLVMAEEDRARVFTSRNPHSVAVFLVDGRAEGGWRYADGRVEIDPWRRLDPATRRAVTAEGERVVAFLRGDPG